MCGEIPILAAKDAAKDGAPPPEFPPPILLHLELASLVAGRMRPALRVFDTTHFLAYGGEQKANMYEFPSFGFGS